MKQNKEEIKKEQNDSRFTGIFTGENSLISWAPMGIAYVTFWILASPFYLYGKIKEKLTQPKILTDEGLDNNAEHIDHEKTVDISKPHHRSMEAGIQNLDRKNAEPATTSWIENKAFPSEVSVVSFSAIKNTTSDCDKTMGNLLEKQSFPSLKK